MGSPDFQLLQHIFRRIPMSDRDRLSVMWGDSLIKEGQKKRQNVTKINAMKNQKQYHLHNFTLHLYYYLYF